MGNNAPVDGLSVSPRETSTAIAAIVAEVDPEFPEHRARTSPDGMMTIVFTDIEASTELMERVGEDRWVATVLTHNRMVRECVLEHGGEIVKSQGDGFMLMFESAGAALRCAADLQRIFAHYNDGHPDEPLRVRIGMHTGNIFQAEDDVIGRTVVQAARITGRARGGEILVSAACRDYTHRLGRWEYGEPVPVRLKGMRDVEQVYRVRWAPA